MTDITDKKRPNLAIHCSEARRTHCENLQDVYFEISREGAVMEVGPRVATLSRGQMKPEDAIGRTVVGFCLDASQHATLARALWRRKRIDDFDIDIIFPGGLIVPCSASATLLRKEGAQRVVGTIRRIGERKLAERALTLLTTGPAHHMEGDQYFGEMACRVAGLFDVEIGFVGRLRPRQGSIRFLALCIDGGEGPRTEYEIANAPCGVVIESRRAAVFQRSVQKLFPSVRFLAELGVESYAAVPLLGKGDLPLGVMGIMSRRPLAHPERTEQLLRVCADRIAAEIERQDAQRRSYDVFDLSPDGMLVVDGSGYIVQANRCAETLFGYAAGELEGLVVEQLLPDRFAEAHRALRREYHAHPASKPMTERSRPLFAKRKDGTMFPIDISLSPLSFGDALGQGVLIDLRDATARVQAEEGRNTLQTQLRRAEKVEAIGTLAGGIAHDFNNILGLVLGNLQLAYEDLAPGHPAIESLDQISKASQRARELIQQILTFGSPVAAKGRPMRLQEVAQEVVELVRSGSTKSVEFSVVFSPDAPYIYADPSQMHQVLMNLCTNAVQALGGRPGRVELCLDDINIGAAGGQFPELAPGRYARLIVRDTGKGMDASTVQQVFDPFFTTKGLGIGTGLGLAVVHGIVRTHEGHIEVQSRLREGSTFSVFFPAVEAPTAPEPDAPNASPAPRGVGERILYLDDDEALVYLLKRMLQRLGYSVEAFTSVREAMAAYVADPSGFDLVISDYNMPEQSGLDVAERIFRIRPGQAMVIISGYVTDELRERGQKIGVRHVIFKPDTIESLADTIDGILTDTV